MRTFKKAMAVGFTTAALTCSAGAVTRYVDPTGTGTGGGQSWPTAFPTLTAAIAGSNTGDVIRVAQGTYKPGTARSHTFTIDRIHVVGGWAGLAGSNPDAHDPAQFVTILSGDIGTLGTHTDNSYNVVTVPANSQIDVNNTRIEDCIIERGYADGGGDDSVGGGIFIGLGAGPLIRGCTIRSNHAAFWGGGIFVDEDADPVIRNSTIELNTAAFSGGGFYILDGAAPKILNSILRENSAQTGGGLQSQVADSVTLVACDIINNTATGNPPSVSGDGGGLRIQGPSGDNTSVTLVNCVFAGNTAEGSNSTGGAVSVLKGLGGITNCTFDANSAVTGGALYHEHLGDSQDIAIVVNSIFWDNGDSEIHAEGSPNTLIVRYCDVHGGSSAVTSGSGATVTYESNNINADPLYVDDTNGDYRLSSCASPAINKGLNSATVADTHDANENANTTEKIDRDFAPRIVFIVDMGAYEMADADPCPEDIDGNCAVDVDDMIAVIMQWLCTSCPADVAPSPCPNGVVDVDDMLAVLLAWGACDDCTQTGEGRGADPQSYEDCTELCSGLSGDAWTYCMQGCFKELCDNGQTEFCDE